jgi:hypothetical protein
MNPFVFTEPISDKRFCDREEAIKFVEKFTLASESVGNVWINGERQIGKTSLLHKLFLLHNTETKIITRYGKESKVTFVYTNVQDCISKDDFFFYLYQKLKETFDFKLKITKNNQQNFLQTLDYIYQKTNSFIVFLVDEFDACLRLIAETDKTAVKQMLNTINRISEGEILQTGLIKKASFVFASNHSLTDLANMDIVPFGSFSVHEYELKWFAQTDIKSMVDLYLAQSKIKFTQKEIKLCYEATSGYPYFTQKLLAIMYEQKPLFDDEKEFRKTIANKYAADIEQTIKTWGGESMPVRTKSGLKKMISGLNLVENFGKAIGTILAEVVKGFL